jgi:hypothetical protein
MNLSEIAFGVMAGFTILFVAAIYLTERKSRTTDFPKSDITESQNETPAESSD